MVFQPSHGIGVAALAIVGLSAAHALTPVQSKQKATREASGNAQLIAEGMHIFRYDTFGDEQLWTDKLRLHEVVEKSVDPTTALSVGLKVDADVLPAGLLKEADLKSPATTVALLKMNAIVGIQAKVDADNRITALGVTCALCHSTVDDSVMPGIGHRQDGWPNRELDVGAIIALSPALTAEQKSVYSSWGPGKYDPRYNQDGQSTPLLIPPAYGLTQVDNATYTAEGPLSYWNAYVAVTQMGGQGNFADSRLKIDIKHSPDLVSSKLPALRAYQYSLPVPRPAARSFNADGAASGRALFNRNCATCHVGGSGTDNNSGKFHKPADIGSDAAYAARTASKSYRTTPLRGLSQHPPYFHDGSAATLQDVVTHYDRALALQLTQQQQVELVEYLKSL
jgi:mono/diheme cytochrome c family protein